MGGEADSRCLGVIQQLRSFIDTFIGGVPSRLKPIIDPHGQAGQTGGCAFCLSNEVSVYHLSGCHTLLLKDPKFHGSLKGSSLRGSSWRGSSLRGPEKI